MLTIVGLLLGCCAISWARTSRKQARIFLGRCLFVGTLIFLGASGSVAALHRADGLIPRSSSGPLNSFMEEPTLGQSRNRSFDADHCRAPVGLLCNFLGAHQS